MDAQRISQAQMDSALERCVRAVPPNHMRDLAPKRGVVAFRCSRTGCTTCADFDTDGRVAFETRLRAEEPGVVIRAWNCDLPAMRELALAAGATDMPAYVLVRSTGDVTVRPVA